MVGRRDHATVAQPLPTAVEGWGSGGEQKLVVAGRRRPWGDRRWWVANEEATGWRDRGRPPWWTCEPRRNSYGCAYK